MNVLLWLAVLVAGFGLFELSQATRGVGFICLAVFLAALARIVQADAHQSAQQQNLPLLSSDRLSQAIPVAVALVGLSAVAFVLLALISLLGV